jgi:excisionase family DNA binding protein
MPALTSATSTAPVPCFLYRHFDAEGNLLYVGVSLSAMNRLAQHKDASVWFPRIATVKIKPFPSREKALAAEREAITAEKPLHNVVHARRQKDVEDEDVRKDSYLALLTRVVRFQPVYRLREAADVLQVSKMDVVRLIETGAIGFVCLGNQQQKYGKYRITGWQLIEFIEAAENAARLEKPGQLQGVRGLHANPKSGLNGQRDPARSNNASAAAAATSTMVKVE